VDADDRFALAYDVTAATGLARARFEFSTGSDPAQWAELVESLPRWLRVAGGVVKPVFQRTVGDVDWSRDAEEGVVDLAGYRSAMCPTHRPIVVVIGSRSWYGVPGEPLVESQSFQADATNPLWLLALVKGVVDASPGDPVVVRGVRCQSFVATADLSRASAATSGGLPPCAVSRVEDLAALPLTIALDDDGRLRRVAGGSFGSTGNRDYVVELFEFGRVAPIDWSRVPDLDRPAA
jgi:hypothetical protein